VSDFLLVLVVAGAAALASFAGGLVGGWRRPSTLLSSVALGLASGVLLGTILFEMLPRAEQRSSVALAAVAFLTGVGAMFGFDLVLSRGRTAGPAADQREQIERFHGQKRERGDEVTRLAGGTVAEEVIEGVSIGVGAAIQPGLALFVAGSIALDNLTEGVSIGALAAESDEQGVGRRRAVTWTGAIGVSLFTSAVLSWLLLRSLPEVVLGFLVAAGGGAMLYLTVTDLVPEAQERQYQQSGALAAALGVAVAFALSRVV
jgi:ZIP family zinc transporter